MEGNTFHTTMAKQSSAITQPVGLSARGRMACMATGYVWGRVGSVANPAEHLRWGISGEILGNLPSSNGDFVLYYIHMVMLDNFSISIFIFCCL